jgi:hypothetical protein
MPNNAHPAPDAPTVALRQGSTVPTAPRGRSGGGEPAAGPAAGPAARFLIGGPASCDDGPCGRVTRIVVDPVARVLTHLVVEPGPGQGVSRLVPLALVEPAVDRAVDPAADGVRVHCDRAGFGALEAARYTQFLPGASGDWDYEQRHMISWPYYGIGMGALSGGGVGAIGMGTDTDPVEVTRDRVPEGEVDVRRGEHVHAADGPIGHVKGLVVAPGGRVTHVLLDEGHLWGRRQVAIPIGAVTRVEDGIHLELTKEQVRDLPAVELR